MTVGCSETNTFLHFVSKDVYEIACCGLSIHYFEKFIAFEVR